MDWWIFSAVCIIPMLWCAVLNSHQLNRVRHLPGMPPLCSTSNGMGVSVSSLHCHWCAHTIAGKVSCDVFGAAWTVSHCFMGQKLCFVYAQIVNVHKTEWDVTDSHKFNVFKIKWNIPWNEKMLSAVYDVCEENGSCVFVENVELQIHTEICFSNSRG